MNSEVRIYGRFFIPRTKAKCLEILGAIYPDDKSLKYKPKKQLQAIIASVHTRHNKKHLDTTPAIR